MPEKLLSIKNLTVSVGEKEVLSGLNLEVGCGQVHAIMGPNGSGKSSLALTLIGSPKYSVKSGGILFKKKEIIGISPEERAKLGLFLGFQEIPAIDGLRVWDFLYKIYSAAGRTNPEDFEVEVKNLSSKLGICEKFFDRHLNIGFSGGEKKKLEVLQMAILKPSLVILDEIDSGLDVDSLKQICLFLGDFRCRNPKASLILITHHTRILKHLEPDFVHVMKSGKVTKTSEGRGLAELIDSSGY